MNITVRSVWSDDNIPIYRGAVGIIRPVKKEKNDFQDFMGEIV